MKSVHSDWHFGQVQMAENGADESTVVFEGRASNGGFAIDDVTVYDGGCESKLFVSLVITSIVSP